jgi:hypothetical protein
MAWAVAQPFGGEIVMRALVVLPLIAALSLTACKKQAVVAKNESMESVANKVAKSGIKPLPGRWESSVKLEKMDLPNMPPEAKAMMDKQMGVTQTFARCLTPEQAAKPDAGFFQKNAEGCAYDHFIMADGRVDAELTCKQATRQIKMTMAGTYSETNYEMHVNSQGEMQPGMPMSMSMSIASHRVGNCNGSEEK